MILLSHLENEILVTVYDPKQKISFFRPLCEMEYNLTEEEIHNRINHRMKTVWKVK